MSETNTQTQSEGQQTQQTEGQTQPALDYDKLASIITGKQAVAEDTVLKSYFRQQGLSEDEMSQAISSYKEQKAKNTPNVTELQNTINSERSARLTAEINQSATLEAIKQGVDVKSIPYVLKMADFKMATDTNGNINSEKIAEAIKTVLDNVPALKGAAAQDGGTGGVQKIGGDGNGASETTEETLRGIFGIKK